jgi:hypothetical protein
MVFSHWGSSHRHTISNKTRKEAGEVYSAFLGFFRQFEFYDVVAAERDVMGVRAAHRGEDLYLYRLTTPVPVARATLLDCIESINALAAKADWYNALTHNCTPTIRRHVRNVAANNPFDWRIVVNGGLPELG